VLEYWSDGNGDHRGKQGEIPIPRLQYSGIPPFMDRRKTMKMNYSRWIIVIVLMLAVAGTYGMLRRDSTRGGQQSDQTKTPLHYQDSMHPWIKSDRPGNCPICGCGLTPIYARENDPGHKVGLVALSANNITVLNVQTEEVKRRPLVRTLRVAGTLEADNMRKTIIGAPAPGRIDAVSVESIGVDVKKGQALATFYSPDLTFQTRRYIFRDRLPDKTDEFGPNPFTQAHPAKHELVHPMPLRGQPAQDPFYNDLLAPLSGTVIERNVFDGQYVAEGDRLFAIVDCSVLWFRFDVYEQQLPWIAPGQEMDVTVASAPGEVFHAVVAIVEPTLNEVTRTVKVRANVDNPLMGPLGRQQRLLKLGMYAEGRLPAQERDVLSVPRSAILFPGDVACVYVDEDDGNYQMRRVKLGRQGDEYWEILAGLTEGERVVSAGNVLIDSQAQFNQSMPRDGEFPEPSPKVVNVSPPNMRAP
jgi:Cu(I)/Ag(I) efflux system membrane fusion protein